MADQDTAGTGAADKGEQEDQNPFAGFQSEGFQHGERIENADTKDTKKEDPAAGKPAADAAAAAASGDRDDDRDDDDPDDEDDKPKDEGKPKNKSASRRIGELTRLRRDADRRAEAAERRLAEIEGRRKDPDAADDRSADAGKPDPSKKGVKSPPDPTDEKKYLYGEIDPKYISDLARYEAEKRFAELQEESRVEATRQQEIVHQRAVQKKFEDQIKVGQEKYEDFDEVVIEGAENNEWLLSRELAELIVESPAGADVAYHLASHPEEAAQVYRQTPMEQARYFGKLEEKFSASQAAATDGKSEDPEKPKLPKAQPPPESPRGRGGHRTTSPETTDFAAFEKMAMKRG